MTDYSELKRAAEAADQGHWNQDGFEVQNDDIEDYRVARCNRLTDATFIAAANPAAVLELITELEKVKADRKACWEEFKAQGRQFDLVKDENENLRKDALRWQCVRNAIPLQSPYAVWREGSHLVLGRDADELVDNFLSHAKEAIHD